MTSQTVSKDGSCDSHEELALNPGLRMHPERTPNPNSVKWVLGSVVMNAAHEAGSFASFSEPVTAEVSPLAARMFAIAGVQGVLLGPDFVTVNKLEATPWADLAPPISAAIEEWSRQSEPALGEAYVVSDDEAPDEVIARIRKVLDEEVGPYVAQDGGEIAFMGFSDGEVRVHLRGACAGCPSATITLKLAIEARLKEEVPEVQSVVALD